MTAPPTRAGVDDRTVVSYDAALAPIAFVLPAVPIAGADTAGGRAAVRGSSRPVDCEEDGEGEKEVRERRGRVRRGARHGAGRAQHARAPTSRSIRSLGANRADGVAHLEGARPAHGLRGPERGAARGLGLQVELVCERVSRERGPPDTILRERWRVRGRGRKNPILVRSGGRGAFAARGLERNGRPRPSRAVEKWRSSRPVRIAIEPRGWRVRDLAGPLLARN